MMHLACLSDPQTDDQKSAEHAAVGDEAIYIATNLYTCTHEAKLLHE